MEFGKTLRLAREAKGYTVAQVAELTRMAPSTVSELENENFSKIAAPIYGRGFVKLYCEVVGIDPKPLVAEFMAVFNGESTTAIRERAVAAPAEPQPPEPVSPPIPPAAPEPEPQPTPPTAPEPEPQPSLFPAEQELPAAVESEPPQNDDPFATFQTGPEVDSGHAPHTLSRYASPLRTMRVPSVSPMVWRIGVLGTLAILLLWGLAIGVRALYRATTSDSAPSVEAPPEPQQTTQEKIATPAAKPAAPAAKTAPSGSAKTTNRTVQKIPSLYADY